MVLQLLVGLPVLLPKVDGLIMGPDGVSHPNLHELHLAAWRLSGDLSIDEAFRERLLQPYAQLIDYQCTILTMPSGGPFLAGVLEGVRIPFTHLLGQFVLLTAPATIRSEKCHYPQPSQIMFEQS